MPVIATENKAMLANSPTAQAMAQKLAEAMASPPLKQSAVAAACGVTKQAVQGWLRTGRFDKKHLPTLAKVTGRPLTWWLDFQDPLAEAEHEATLLDRAYRLQDYFENTLKLDGYEGDVAQDAIYLARVLGRAVDECDKILSGKIDIDDALAREIEAALDLESGYLDQVGEAPTQGKNEPTGHGSVSSQVIADLTRAAATGGLSDADWQLIALMVQRLTRNQPNTLA